MLIALLSTLIASIALVGVAISLLLQARQLRTNQLQATYTAQVELIKLGLDNPSLSAGLAGFTDTEDFVKEVSLNWHISYLAVSYEIKTMSEPNLRRMLGDLFASEDSRMWWARVGYTYDDGATSRRGKNFFAIVNEEVRQASLTSESAGTGAVPPDMPNTSPPPST